MNAGKTGVNVTAGGPRTLPLPCVAGLFFSPQFVLAATPTRGLEPIENPFAAKVLPISLIAT